MNNQTLVIYDFKILYEILKEVEEHLNFNLINTKKLIDKDHKTKKNLNYLIISNKKIKDFDEYMLVNLTPINLTKLIESINVRFLKKKYKSTIRYRFRQI